MSIRFTVQYKIVILEILQEYEKYTVHNLSFCVNKSHLYVKSSKAIIEALRYNNQYLSYFTKKVAYFYRSELKTVPVVP